MSSQVVLEAKNLTKVFGKGKEMQIANDNLNFSVQQGELLGIVGESGCGKSTLARQILSLEKPTSGELLINGLDVSKLKGKALRESRQDIQMIFQDPSESLNPKMKVKQIVCEPLLNFKRLKFRDINEKAKELLEMVGLSEDFVDRYPHSMSGGQRQRICIARALALSPKIVVLDEATSALDVSVQKSIVDLLFEIKQKNDVTFIFICHDIALIRSIADRILVMNQGNIVETLEKEKKKRSDLHPYTKELFDSVFSLSCKDVAGHYRTRIKMALADTV